MEVKLVLDNELLSKLDNEAMKLLPGSSFEFRVKILKNADHQVTMSRSQGDRSGYVFFVQGCGKTFDEACSKLVESFLSLITVRKETSMQGLQSFLKKHNDEQESLQSAEDQIRKLIPTTEE